MNRNLKISFAIVVSCFASAYGMNFQPNNIHQRDNSMVTNVTSPVGNTMGTTTSPNIDISAMNNIGNVRDDTIHLQIAPELFPLLNENGLRIVEQEVNNAYRNLSKWQQERLRFLAGNGQFDAYKGFIKFWRVIEAIAYPVSSLAHLINSLLPVAVIAKGDSLWLDWAMCVSGVLGLFFEQISTYAGNRISEETAISDILRVLRRKTSVGVNQHSINDQREPLNNRASSDLSISSAEEVYMEENV